MILQQLDRLLKSRSEEVEAWLEGKKKHCSHLFYSSVDVRHSGYKLAPVDTNVFPAGFNNLYPKARQKAAELAARFIRRCCPYARKVVLIPENHTRNLRYIDNLEALLGILLAAGYEAVLGRIEEGVREPVELLTSGGVVLYSSPLLREGDRLRTVDGFVPDVVLVNNDFTSGAPAMLQNVALPVVPPPGMGWYRRRKSEHFASYNRLIESFARAFGFDSWQLSTPFARCGEVDFRERGGLECVAIAVEKLLRSIQEKYDEYGIGDPPYAFIKADSGTYGMGIMTVRSGGEVLEMNKKARHTMDVIKEGTQNTEVIIQEGVPTIDRVNGMVAEPLLYLIDAEVAGGMYRAHAERDGQSSLNTPGMQFFPMQGCAKQISPEADICAAASLVARLATIAAAHEEYRE